MTKRSAREKKTAKGDYTVGYARTPVHARFKPGQSGYKQGRPKGSLSASPLLRKILSEKVKLREGERVLVMTRMEAIMRSHVSQAMKGNTKSLNAVLAMHKENEENAILAPRFVLQINGEEVKTMTRTPPFDKNGT